MYFTPATQDAIVAHRKSSSKSEKDRIYVAEIMPAFQKLVENLINIHKFTDLYDNFEDLRNDCVNFLFETIPKFDETRGTNAFSYFNVVAKNWLIIRTKQKTLRIKRYVSIDDVEMLSLGDYERIENHSQLPAQDQVMIDDQTRKSIMEALGRVLEDSTSENEKSCLRSIIRIFEEAENLDFFNKNAVMLYIREMSGLTSKQLTAALQQVRVNFREELGDPDDV